MICFFVKMICSKMLFESLVVDHFDVLVFNGCPALDQKAMRVMIAAGYIT
jgi:hypothetical protein